MRASLDQRILLAEELGEEELVRIADVKTDTARVISENAELFPGVRVDVEARRKYPQGNLPSQFTSALSSAFTSNSLISIRSLV